ncbi:MAG: hypothetical protein DRI44_09395, partial [Chlamydiae bacterium]
MKSRVKYYILFIVLFSLLINISIAETYQTQNIDLGMWWITESHVLLNTSKLDSGPPKLQDTVFYHKWITSNFKKYNGENVWIIDIYPYNIPDNIQNDHGENFIFRLWLAETNFALRRLDANFRHGKYLVTGDFACQQKQIFSETEPVSVTWLPEICPLDVPVLPVNWREKTITNKQQNLSVKDERTGDFIQQSITVLSNKPPEAFGIVVKLKTKNSDTRIQTWIKNCPWWIEWHCDSELTNHPGLISAKTINWKGK